MDSSEGLKRAEKMALKLGNGKKCIVPSPAVPIFEGGDCFQDTKAV